MKLNATVLIVMLLALSGFTWGSSDDEKTVSKTASSTASNAVSSVKVPAKKRASSSMSNSYNSASSYKPTSVPASVVGDRANAIRILTSGDAATRKARMDSITRLAKSMAAAKQAQTAQDIQNIPTKKSYQY